MFAIQKFVVHSHKQLENRTCHWGFDSDNWRSYILLAKDQDSRESMQRALDDIKDKFDFVAGYKKRRERSNKTEDGDIKRARYEDAKDLDASSPWAVEFVRGMSAFRPWSPSLATLLKEGKLPTLAAREGLSHLLPSYLQTGPPVLLNPERVVPFTDTKSYDRHFAPNVSLAPQVGKEDSKEGLEFESPVKVDPKFPSCASSLSSSTLSSALSSPSPIKLERNPELELSSSDESSFRSESVPTTPREERHSVSDNGIPTELDLAADRDLLISLVRQSLDAGPDTKPEDRGRLLERVAEVCGRQEDRVRHLLSNRGRLILDQDKLRASKRDRLQEMSESRHMMRLQVECLTLERQAQAEEMLADRQRFAQELEQLRATKHADILRVKTKYKGQVEVQKMRISEYEQLHRNMATEISSLKKQVKLLSRDTHNNHRVAAPVNHAKRRNGELHAHTDTEAHMEASIADNQPANMEVPAAEPIVNGDQSETANIDNSESSPRAENMDT